VGGMAFIVADCLHRGGRSGVGAIRDVEEVGNSTVSSLWATALYLCEGRIFPWDSQCLSRFHVVIIDRVPLFSVQLLL
jgi:hypothetical protein